MTALFVIPVLFIVFISYRDVGSSYNAMNWNNESQNYSQTSDYHWNALSRFADWLLMMMMRSDLGVWGFLLSLLIHLQIYCVLFGLSWCSYTVGQLVGSISKLREIQAGTYTGLELRFEKDREEMSFTRQEDQI